MAETDQLYACPYCRMSYIWMDDNPSKPFCSNRCQLLDLGKWLNEEYRIPGEEGMDETTSPDQDD